MNELTHIKAACINKPFKSFVNLKVGDYVVENFQRVSTSLDHRIRVELYDCVMYLPECYTNHINDEILNELDRVIVCMSYYGKNAASQELLDFTVIRVEEAGNQVSTSILKHAHRDDEPEDMTGGNPHPTVTVTTEYAKELKEKRKSEGKNANTVKNSREVAERVKNSENTVQAMDRTIYVEETIPKVSDIVHSTIVHTEVPATVIDNENTITPATLKEGKQEQQQQKSVEEENEIISVRYGDLKDACPKIFVERKKEAERERGGYINGG